MMKSAKQRAQAFARKHGLPFTPAQMRMSLHAGRPQQRLVMETDDSGHNDIGLVGNSLALRRQIATRHHLLQA